SYTFVEGNNTLKLNIDFRTDLFTASTVETYYLAYLSVIRPLLQKPLRKISDIDLVTNDERRRILEDFNRTAADFPKHRSLVSFFMEQALRSPDAIALRQDDKIVSYQELDVQSSQIAFYLMDA